MMDVTGQDSTERLYGKGCIGRRSLERIALEGPHLEDRI